MDFFILALGLLGVFAGFGLAFVAYEALAIFFDFVKEICKEGGYSEESRLILRLPSKALSVLLVLCFVAVAL